MLLAPYHTYSFHTRFTPEEVSAMINDATRSHRQLAADLLITHKFRYYGLATPSAFALVRTNITRFSLIGQRPCFNDVLGKITPSRDGKGSQVRVIVRPFVIIMVILIVFCLALLSALLYCLFKTFTGEQTYLYLVPLIFLAVIYASACSELLTEKRLSVIYLTSLLK